MAFALNISSTNTSSNKIKQRWQTCGALEETPSMQALAYYPHITLAIYDEIDVDLLSDRSPFR